MRVLIAGGGTGGHVFPGIALAEEVVTRHAENDVVFVGTNRGLEAKVVPQNGFVFEAIPSRGLKGMGPVNLALGVALLPVSFFRALVLVAKYRPDVVVGVGGYSSGPVVMAAWMLGIPTAVQEQNALPGMTNRFLGRFVKAAFVAFDVARSFFPKGRSHLLGNPIRRTLLENFLHSKKPHARFTVLIVGGSLGAHGLNVRIIDALSYLSQFKEQLHFVHQTGKADYSSIAQAYDRHSISAEVKEFIDDMSAAYATSDLVICRAGAITLSELAVCRKASILVPFPAATDDHQAVNAQAMVDAGAAIMFREAALTGAAISQAVIDLMGDQPRRMEMEKAAGAQGRPQAAGEIADVLQQLCLERWGALNGKKRNAPPLRSPRKET